MNERIEIATNEATKKYEDASLVIYKKFIFVPHFDVGQHAGEFLLIAYSYKYGYPVKTSAIKSIEIDGDAIYVSTRNSVYKIENPEDVNTTIVEKIQQYLTNVDFTSQEFLDRFVPNMPPTMDGWNMF